MIFMKGLVGVRIFVLFFLLVLFGSSFVDGALLGVNRASLSFNNVLRSGYAEQQVTVTIGQPNDVLVSFEARGEIADWIRFEPAEQSFLVNEDNPGVINVIVEPPLDARVDDYSGMVFISTGALGNISSPMGTNVIVAFEVDVSVSLTDTQILSCSAGGFSLSDFEIGGEGEFRASVKNSGNVRVRPSFGVKVFSQMQDELLIEYEFSSDSEVIPTRSGVVEELISFDLEPGQYWAEISEPVCGSRSTLTFSVLERGGISDVGEFSRLSAKTWASVGEIIPVVASFKNDGSRTVSAQFKGTVSKDGVILDVLESDTINVPAGEEVDLEVFYVPEELGHYRVSGRVHFNNKVSFERSSVFNVNEESSSDVSGGSDMLVLFLSVLIVIFALLVFLILRKKKRKRKRF